MASAFAELGVCDEITEGLDEIGWSLPTDIQAEAVPLILGGGDVLMAAETGSGKTGAFCLPVIQIVQETKRENASGGSKRKSNTSSTKCILVNSIMLDNLRGPVFAISNPCSYFNSHNFW